MPLVRFEVRNEYGLGDPELYRAAPNKDDPKAIIDGVAVAGLVGILRQLGDLAEFASDVFHDLHEQVTVTSARGHKLLNRIQHLETALPSYENAIHGQRNHIHFAYAAGSDWHADPKIKQSHLLSSDLPRYMMDSYEECQDPPRLYLLDKFDSAGSGACLKRYSDPSYFKRVWATSELEKAKKFQRENKAQKIKKKGSRIKIGEVQHGVSSSRHYSSTQFSSPDTDEQQFSTEAAHISDTKLKPELASRSTSFGSMARLNYAEQVPDRRSLGVPDELEHDRFSGFNLQIGRSCSFASDIRGNVNGVSSTHDGSPRNSLKEENAHRSPSVTWDEKTELASRTVSFGSRIMLNYAEQVPDTSSSGMPDELEHDRFSRSNLQIGQSGSFASDRHDEVDGVSGTCDGSSHSSLKEENAHRSPSVTWDEKTEIHKPTSPTSCDDRLVDDTQYLEPIPVSSKKLNVETETAILETLERENSIFGTADVPAPLTSVNRFDDTTSDTDNYMDALNTLESEAETDSECQTKHEVKSFSNFNCSQIESETAQMQEAASPSSVFSGAVTAGGSDSATNEDESPITMPSESLEPVQEPEAIDSLPDPEDSISNQSSKQYALDMYRRSNFEGAIDDQPPELGICTSLEILEPRAADMCKSPGSSPLSISSVPSAHFWTNGGLLGLEPSKPPDFSAPKAQSKDFVSDSINSAYDHSSKLGETKLPNNGILPNASLNQSTLSADQQFGRNHNVVPQIDPSQCSPSYSNNQLDIMPANQNSQRHLPVPLSIQPEKIQDVVHTNIHAQKRFDVTVPRGTQFPSTHSVDSQPDQSCQNTMDIASSLSALAQKILTNSLSRKPSISHAPYVDANADISKPKDASLQNNQNEEKTGVVSKACYPENSSNIKNTSSKNLILSRSYVSGHSSPPLEHMKISFHPMNGLETSRLKLEYAGGNFHESIEELTFPSFQLLPGSNLPSGDNCSETDDDTFCRSCPCTSEDHLSPRSDSNSELWGQDDMSGEKHHYMYNNLHRVSLSSSSVSSFKGFDHMSQIDRANGFEDLEAESSILFFQNGYSAGLPALDSFTSTSDMLCDPLSPGGSASQSQNELPLPPLPPMQWRMTKASFAKEEKGSSVAEIVEHFNVLQAQRFTASKQHEQIIPRPPPVLENMACPFKKPQEQQTPDGQIELNHASNSKLDMKEELLHQFKNLHDGQKLNGHKENRNNDVKRKQLDEREELLHEIRNKFDQQNVNGHKEPNNPHANSQEVDEREELLHQIRNKSFNLRRTSTPKLSGVPESTTNINVAAILEKANAIRQAFVGSDDDGGDDDNWSDG